MILNSIVCSDCEEIMTVYELHDLYCEKTNMVMQLEERLCLHCSARILQIVGMFSSEQAVNVGRSETLAVTFNSNKRERTFSKTLISKLMRLHYLEKVKNICFCKSKHVWYKGFELDLWESLNGDNKLSLSEEEINSLKDISNGLSVWAIDPEDWIGYENLTSNFINIRAWQRLYEKRSKLFKPTANAKQTGTTSAGAESEGEDLFDP